MSGQGPILYYDGVCALCNGAVNFVLKRDKSRIVKFAPLQGENAKALFASHCSLQRIDSMVWVGADGNIAIRSDAALAIGRYLGGLWGFVAALGRIVPRAVRDGIYDLVARIRYKTFGKYDACPIPPAEHRARFLA